MIWIDKEEMRIEKGEDIGVEVRNEGEVEKIGREIDGKNEVELVE